MNKDLTTVLTAIDGLRSDVREDQSKIWEAIDNERKCTTNLKIENERRKAESEKVELKQNMTEGAFIRHVQNQEKHFNPFYNETIPQKLWRKKPEIGASITIGGIIFGMLLAALKFVGWIQ